ADPAGVPPVAGAAAAQRRRAEAAGRPAGDAGDRRVPPADHAGGRGGDPRRPLRRRPGAVDGARPGAGGRPGRLARPAGAVRDDEAVPANLRPARPARPAAGGPAAGDRVTLGVLRDDRSSTLLRSVAKRPPALPIPVHRDSLTIVSPLRGPTP